MEKIFRIKMRGPGSGAKKQKNAYLVEAINYTEAEAFAVELLKREGYTPNESEYEISATKFTSEQILNNGNVLTKEEYNATHDELYFSGTYDGIFTVKTKRTVTTEDELITETHLVADKSTESAAVFVQNYLKTMGGDVVVVDTKLDMVDSLMLLKSTADRLTK